MIKFDSDNSLQALPDLLPGWCGLPHSNYLARSGSAAAWVAAEQGSSGDSVSAMPGSVKIMLSYNDPEKRRQALYEASVKKIINANLAVPQEQKYISLLF